MTQEEKDFIEIPFGAKDSELIEATYYIPEGMEAVIEDNKVVIRKKECKTTNKNNPFLGWIVKDNPNFWEDNGYKKIIPNNDYHYYGCKIAKANNYPIYKKQLYINYDMEDESYVEVFACESGVIKHAHIVAIHTWNNAGGCKFSLNIAKQIFTIDDFNDLIMEYIGDDLEGGSYLLRR